MTKKRSKQKDLLPVTKHWAKIRVDKAGYPRVTCYNCKDEFFDDNKVNKRVKCPTCGYRGYED